MLYEVDWAEDGTYRPDEENSPEKFFNDCLNNSKEFDLQLGYFSSATISVLADGFATFISNGGKMRLVINHIVSEEDKEAIEKGVLGKGIIECFDLTNFEKLRDTFDEYQKQFFECLAFLIYDKRIEIKIIRPRNKKGIAHTKSGQFRDGDSTTSFTGSANFTISGLFNNLEEIKIDRSDSIDMMVQKRIKSQRDEFELIMKEKKTNIEYLSPDKLIAAIQSNFGDKSIEELLDVEQKLRSIKKAKAQSQQTKPKPINSDGKSVKGSTPQFPYPSGPREYQQTAFNNWKNNKQKGLFAMATGTGKTITSLNCLLEIYKLKGYYKAVILVPTITLVNQWEQECRKFNFTNIVKVCSKNPRWRKQIDQLHFLESIEENGNNSSFIIISTYASFAIDNVFAELNSFAKTKTLLIADEAHNMGSPQIRNKIPAIKYARRIGLSATPEHPFDGARNRELFEFFGSADGFTFELLMEDAIRQKFLCQYFYYPHLVELTNEEMVKYTQLSKKIAKLFFSQRSKDEEEMLQVLLLARKRIVHKAANKLAIFKEIIENRLTEKGNLKYSLIYVPEGNKPDNDTISYALNDDTSDDDNETLRLIDEYTKVVKDTSPKTTVKRFISGSSDRDSVLKDFADGTLEVLTSMKCLDEGVDVPRSEFAVFCASTGNPRQFIQRRGRILRKHPDKPFAVIHDLVVAPCMDHDDIDSFKAEQKLIDSELRRVRDFAKLSLNFADSEKALHDVVKYYNLSIF